MVERRRKYIRLRVMACISGRDPLWVVDWEYWKEERVYTLLVYMARREQRHRFVKETMQRHRWDVATFCRAQVA